MISAWNCKTKILLSLKLTLQFFSLASCCCFCYCCVVPLKPTLQFFSLASCCCFCYCCVVPLKPTLQGECCGIVFYPYRELSELYKGTDKYGNEMLFMMYLNGLLYQFQNVIGSVVSRYHSVMCSNTIKGSRCFLEQETLPLLLSTGWFPYSNMIYMSKHCLF